MTDIGNDSDGIPFQTASKMAALLPTCHLPNIPPCHDVCIIHCFLQFRHAITWARLSVKRTPTAS
jgi:hypothetical protein